jgi:L-threonylcarbamoyladenylate synthase
MKRLVWQKKDDVALLERLLKNGEVVISSTDTLYGFLSETSSQCFDRISSIKKTAINRPFLVLVGSIEKISPFVDMQNISNRIVQFLSLCWPGPLTVIFDSKPGLPSHMASERGTIALRCPNHVGLLSILDDFDGLFSTSANISGEAAPARFSDMSQEILKSVNYVVVDDPEKVSGGKPSTIIDFSQKDITGDLPFKIIREGAFSISKLEEFSNVLGKNL